MVQLHRNYEEYLDIYDGIQSDIVSSSRFDKNSDVSTTYLRKIGNMEGQDKLNAELLGRLLDGTKCQFLLDTGTSKSFMSKSFYMQCKSLHNLPNLLLPHKEYRLEMVSVLAYCS